MRKVTIILIALAMVITFAVGCQPETTTTTTTTTADGETTTEPTEEPKEAVVLQAYFYDVGRQAEYDELYADFTKQYPNISVETTLSAVDYDSNMMAMIASDSMPDIIMGQYPQLTAYGEAGHLIDITNEEFIDNYPDWIIAQMIQPDGKIYGLPTNVAAMGYFYNQEMFEQAGIEEFPKTITEMQEAIDTLIANGIIPFSVAGAEAWTLGQVMGVTVSSVVPDIVENSLLRRENPDTDIYLEEMLTAFKTVDMQFDNAIESAPSNDYGTFLNDFATGKVAIIQMGTWALASINGLEPDFTVRYAAPPYSENAEDVRLSVNIGVSQAISTQTLYPEECLKLFGYLASPEGNTLFGKLFGEIPAIKGADFDYCPVTSDIKGYIDASAICPWSQVYMSRAGWEEGGPTMQMYYFDQISAEEAITKYFADWFK